MKALYHREGNEPKELTVLKKNKDGTVNLGPEGGEAVVTDCKVVEGVEFGSATLIPEPVQEKSK